ncbi:MAG: DUF2007 domain-containing protein [Bacteroidales bacterium]|nr:DUF2007 domain-containing protein [Bacteroidales bacterium]
MSNWTKIMSFDNVYEAEIRRQLLQNAEIQSVVVNARDSLFLIGNAELYVSAEDEKKALIILEQFQGLTKINSFILKKPMLLFQKLLKEHNIETVLKERDDDKYIIENYELYINNEQILDAVPYLTGEKLEGWGKVEVCEKVRQTRYRIEMLDEAGIDAIVVKKRDSDFHLEDITIFVEEKNFEKAKTLLSKLENWKKIKTYQKHDVIELKEDILAKEGIRALIINKNNEFGLYVKENKATKAEDIVKATKEWVEVRRYNTFVEADALLNILLKTDIDASILTIRDSMFLIGGYAIYVEKRKINEAIEILTEAEGGKITE